MATYRLAKLVVVQTGRTDWRRTQLYPSSIGSGRGSDHWDYRTGRWERAPSRVSVFQKRLAKSLLHAHFARDTAGRRVYRQRKENKTVVLWQCYWCSWMPRLSLTWCMSCSTMCRALCIHESSMQPCQPGNLTRCRPEGAVLLRLSVKLPRSRNAAFFFGNNCTATVRQIVDDSLHIKCHVVACRWVFDRSLKVLSSWANFESVACGTRIVLKSGDRHLLWFFFYHTVRLTFN
jgi:hypothetical protein